MGKHHSTQNSADNPIFITWEILLFVNEMVSWIFFPRLLSFIVRVLSQLTRDSCFTKRALGVK